MPRAVVIGGGIGGLTAAHELIERGFEVTVFERGSIAGGKARSFDVPETAPPGGRALPGEHGFRFFPYFYKHLPDTMERIPFPGNRRGVRDNLVKASHGLFARCGGPSSEIVTRLPRSSKDLRKMLNALFGGLQLDVDDLGFFAGRLWRFITSCSARRLNEYEPMSWTEFVHVDGQSESYKAVFTGLTRTFVAMSSDTASARTVGDVVVQLLLGGLELTASDRVLNGPTNEVWIDPWLDYLRAKGVEFHAESGVEAIDCDDCRITGVRVQSGPTTTTVDADVYVAAVPVDVMARLSSDEIVRADPAFALVRTLSTYVDWMNGIQLFVKEDTPIIGGHALFLDAPWGLTSISQNQFWKTKLWDRGDGSVRDVISVDICAWDVPSTLEHRGQRRTAKECTRDEIYKEVWAQLKSCLNYRDDVQGKDIVGLRDDVLHSFSLDPGITLAAEGAAVSSNAEPMFVNCAGTWGLRPTAYTQIPNMFLAADYVQTHTDLATMEGANEAARRAVNAICETYGGRGRRAHVWRLNEPALLAPWRMHDAIRFRRGLPWREPLGGTFRRIETGLSDVLGMAKGAGALLGRLIGR